MNFDDLFKDRNDDATARRWRGVLFRGFKSPLMWKDKHYKTLEPPGSVTFPICAFCGHIVWEWPHFEEKVPDSAICEQCAREENEAQENDMLR